MVYRSVISMRINTYTIVYLILTKYGTTQTYNKTSNTCVWYVDVFINVCILAVL